MRKAILLMGAVALVGHSTPATAGVYADDLARCLVTSSTEADRSAFVRWMFAAMSANSSVSDLAHVTVEQRIAISEEAAELLQRLLLTDCRQQVQQAIRYEGEHTISGAFAFFGQVAMSDLMSDPLVAIEMDRMAEGFDEEAMEALVREATGRTVSTPESAE